MSRFEDNLHRDLTVIADRATPSPDAWASIQQRIADQDPIQETEIIMLTDNTTTTRRWPLVAAAAAVVALVVGAVALVGTGDDDVPADDPTPTVAPTPPPDEDAAPPDDAGTDGDADPPTDAEPAVVETEEPAVDEPATEAAPADETDVAPGTISLTGTTEGVVEFDQASGTYTADENVSGDAIGTATATGTAAVNAGGDGLDGAGRRVLSLTIDGVGSGSLVIDDRWSSSFDGATESTGTIVGGTDDFAGATGTWEGSFPAGSNDLDTEPIETGGPYTMELTLPADGQPAANLVIGGPDSALPAGTYTTDSLGTPVTFDLGEPVEGTWAAASWQGGVWLYRGNAREFIQLTRVGGWYDAEEARNPATNGRASFGAADLDDWIENAEDIRITDLGDVTVGARPARLIEFGVDPSSDAGDGICEPESQPCVWYFERSADDVRTDGGRGNSMWAGREARAYIVDMDGYEPILIEGSTALDDQQAWLDEVFQPVVDSMVIGEPAPTVPGGSGRATTRVTATGTWSDDAYTETPQEGSTTLDVSYTTFFEGDMTGQAPTEGWRTPNETDAGSTGGGSATFTGTIAGLGEGTLTTEEIFTAPPTVFLSVSLITGGTGDFEGATGTATIDQGSYVFEIEVPEVPIERPRQFDLETSWTDGDYAEEAPADDGSVAYTGRTMFEGTLAGDTPFVGTKQLDADGNWLGTTQLAFTGTIDGVGTGTLTMTDTWRSDPSGQYIDALRIEGGTGDFDGAAGWLLLRSSDGGTTGAGTGELRLPAG